MRARVKVKWIGGAFPRQVFGQIQHLINSSLRNNLMTIICGLLKHLLSAMNGNMALSSYHIALAAESSSCPLLDKTLFMLI